MSTTMAVHASALPVCRAWCTRHEYDVDGQLVEHVTSLTRGRVTVRIVQLADEDEPRIVAPDASWLSLHEAGDLVEALGAARRRLSRCSRDPRIDAEPLVTLIRKQRPRMTPAQATAFFRARRLGTITVDAADDLCTSLLQTHPAGVFGEGWWELSARV